LKTQSIESQQHIRMLEDERDTLRSSHTTLMEKIKAEHEAERNKDRQLSQQREQKAVAAAIH